MAMAMAMAMALAMAMAMAMPVAVAMAMPVPVAVAMAVAMIRAFVGADTNTLHSWPAHFQTMASSLSDHGTAFHVVLATAFQSCDSGTGCVTPDSRHWGQGTGEKGRTHMR